MADSEEQELKAGHAPAVKAGGKRIVQHKSPGEDTPVEKLSSDEQAVAQRPDIDPVVMSGYVTKGNKDFPAEAIKSFHDKPMPTHEKSHAPSIKQNINQPRKQ